jgi:polysaccharide biosynthesis/export protein
LPISLRTGARPGAWCAIAGSLLLSLACASPGMKLNTVPGKSGLRTQVQDMEVVLRPMSPEVVKDYGTLVVNTAGLEDLLSVKPTPYLIGPQDIILVTVWEHPELTIPLGQFRSDAATGQVVDDEGNVFWPYVGTVNVSGQTAMQVRSKLVDRMARALKNPQVDVKVIVYRSQKVFVGGEVKVPGIQNITDVPFTVAQAVGNAGGFLPTADASRVILARGNRSYSINFNQLMKQSSRYGQILLKDGDSLHVSNRDEETVYMMGEFRAPRALPLYHGRLSLAQAITEAGGLDLQSANAHSIYVLRRGPTENSADLFHLDSRHPAAMVLADRFALQPRDIVYVDAGTLVRWNRVLNLLLPTFSSLIQSATDIKYLK